MGKDVMDENADQIKFNTRPFHSFGMFMSIKACILSGCLTGDAAEYSERKSTVSIKLCHFRSALIPHHATNNNFH